MKPFGQIAPSTFHKSWPARLSVCALVAAASVPALFLGIPRAHAADVVKIGTPLALTGSLADEGKKQDVVWAMWLAKVNGIPRDGITILGVGGDAPAGAALEQGRIDALVTYDPLASELVRLGRAAYLYDMYQPAVAHRARRPLRSRSRSAHARCCSRVATAWP